MAKRVFFDLSAAKTQIDFEKTSIQLQETKETLSITEAFLELFEEITLSHYKKKRESYADILFKEKLNVDFDRDYFSRVEKKERLVELISLIDTMILEDNLNLLGEIAALEKSFELRFPSLKVYKTNSDFSFFETFQSYITEYRLSLKARFNLFKHRLIEIVTKKVQNSFFDLRLLFRRIIQFFFKNMDDETDKNHCSPESLQMIFNLINRHSYDKITNYISSREYYREFCSYKRTIDFNFTCT